MADRWDKRGKPKNVWNKGPPKSNQGDNAQPKAEAKSSRQSEIPDRFTKASQNMQASVLKHVQKYESSSDEEELEEDSILVSVMEKYSNNQADANLEKTREFLEQSFQSGAAICLICIASVKRVQQIWSCNTCYTAFHLQCIQRWAASTIYQQSESNDQPVMDLPVRVKNIKKIEWCCPKCRNAYEQDDVPKIYECFCKKTTNPEFHPWLIPHSCGTICDKALVPECGHRCLLLCHPGACPPCPKTVLTICYCKQSDPKIMRCSSAKWSCNKKCNKQLSCKLHRCEEICHPGDCGPCPKVSVQFCQCKRVKASRLCADSKFQCDNVCDKAYSCGFHKCEYICHENKCGECPFSGLQKCPCGAIRMNVLCPEEVATCGGTCNKVLPCETHTCPNKCHKGICPPCPELIEKKCRCGLHTKQLPCNKQYLCESKCRILKTCGRHGCSRRCCDGNCLPCDKLCGKTLQCRKHKCPNPCHKGPCYPCPLTAKVTCRCGGTFYSVPCGVEKKTRPPKCVKNCRIPGSCNHVKENVHKCHFDSCPPCKQRCGKLLECKHNCPKLCHNAVPILIEAPKPAGPWEIQPPKIEIRSLPCPPCVVPVAKPCLGGHELTQFPCHEARVTSCGRQCNRPLSCTNHFCSRECHPVEPEENDETEKHKCENCNKSCEFPRLEGCKHSCNKGCHPAPCEPCHQFLKRQCHCGLTELFIRCYSLSNPIPNDTKDILSCKEQCIRILECGHRCSINCHPGPCPDDCSKKTKVYCPCRRIKRETQCNLVRSNEATVLCNDVCKEKLKQQLEIKEEEERKKKLKEDEKNRRELEEFEKKFGERKYRKSRPRDDTNNKRETGFWIKYKYFIIFFFIAVTSIATTYIIM